MIAITEMLAYSYWAMMTSVLGNDGHHENVGGLLVLGNDGHLENVRGPTRTGQ